MITLKLKELGEKLNKSISDIARETGINRNTITALYHNKVDGIKFDTIKKICEKYGLDLPDLLELIPSKDAIKTNTKSDWYRQEAEAVPFTCWTFIERIVNDKYEIGGKVFRFGDGYCYYKNDYCWLFWDTPTLYRLAEAIYKRYKTDTEMVAYFNRYVKASQVLERIYFEADQLEILSFDKKEVLDYFKKVREAYKIFWVQGLFIDSFDAGFDQKTIQAIAKQYSLTVEEIGILTTPVDMTFNNQRLLELLRLTKIVKSGLNSKQKLEKLLAKYDDKITKYIKEFDYYKSNYSVIKHITRDEVINEIKTFLKNEKKFNETYEKLINYQKNQDNEIKKILKRHKLKQNPLFFFNQLTYWREHRKKINLMGIHVLDMILMRLEAETGIPKKYLRFLSFDEFEGALHGTVKQSMLMNRHDKGTMVCLYENDYQILEDKEAASIKEDLDRNINQTINFTELKGQTASQGYAKGVARIILDQKDFGKLKKGEVLVTGMTRPEFVPIMEKAAAIVTNEGGITCHAAIVSRELGKPCIIGTKNATQVIKDGDLVEVRANHGTVKILKS